MLGSGSNLGANMTGALHRMLAAFMLFTLCLSAPVQAENRVALVVGIADYHTLPDLRNTLNDHDLLGAALNGLGL